MPDTCFFINLDSDSAGRLALSWLRFSLSEQGKIESMASTAYRSTTPDLADFVDSEAILPAFVYDPAGEKYYYLENKKVDGVLTLLRFSYSEGQSTLGVVGYRYEKKQWRAIFDVNPNSGFRVTKPSRYDLTLNSATLLSLKERLKEENVKHIVEQYQQLNTAAAGEANSSEITAPVVPEIQLPTTEEIIRISNELLEVLSEEKRPLPLMVRAAGHSDSPVFFSASLIMLVRRRISPLSISRSGLLAAFLLSNIDHIDIVRSAYQALEQIKALPDDTFSVALDFLKSVLNEAKTSNITSIAGNRNKAQSFKHLTLSGEKMTPARDGEPQWLNDFSLVPFTVTATPSNLSKLYAYFGEKFLIELLNLNNNKNITDFLTNTINQLSAEELMKYYRILNAYDNQSQSAMQLLINLLSDDRVFELLQQPSSLRWIILAKKQDIFETLSEERFRQLMEPLILGADMNEKSVQALLSLVGHPRLSPYRDKIGVAVAEFYLAKSDTLQDINPIVLTRLNNISMVTHWSLEKQRSYLRELTDLVANGISEDSYLAANDHYNSHVTKVNFLRKLRQENVYPVDPNQFKSFCIDQASKQANFDLNACWDVMFKYDDLNYPDQQDQINARLRSLDTRNISIESKKIFLQLVDILLSKKYPLENIKQGIIKKFREVLLTQDAFSAYTGFFSSFFSLFLDLFTQLLDKGALAQDIWQALILEEIKQIEPGNNTSALHKLLEQKPKELKNLLSKLLNNGLPIDELLHWFAKNDLEYLLNYLFERGVPAKDIWHALLIQQNQDGNTALKMKNVDLHNKIPGDRDCWKIRELLLKLIKKGVPVADIERALLNQNQDGKPSLDELYVDNHEFLCGLMRYGVSLSTICKSLNLNFQSEAANRDFRYLVMFDLLTTIKPCKITHQELVEVLDQYELKRNKNFSYWFFHQDGSRFISHLKELRDKKVDNIFFRDIYEEVRDVLESVKMPLNVVLDKTGAKNGTERVAIELFEKFVEKYTANVVSKIATNSTSSAQAQPPRPST